jgi:hypothetical protein
LDVPAIERRELAAAQGAAQKHCQNRPVPFSFRGVRSQVTEQLSEIKSPHCLYSFCVIAHNRIDQPFGKQSQVL